jgi:hypothetical protein
VVGWVGFLCYSFLRFVVLTLAPSFSHSGNKGFRSMVKAHQGQYLRAKKQNKLLVASALVKKIRAKGGRFLKRHSTSKDGVVCWVDIGDEEAIIKAAQCLR